MGSNIQTIYQGSVYYYSSLLDNSQDRLSTSKLSLLLIISSLKYILMQKVDSTINLIFRIPLYLIQNTFLYSQ